MAEREPQTKLELGMWGDQSEKGPGWKTAGVSANAQPGDWARGFGVNYQGSSFAVHKMLLQKTPGAGAQLVWWHDIPQRGAFFHMRVRFFRMESTAEGMAVPVTITTATAASADDLVAGNFTRQAKTEWTGVEQGTDGDGTEWFIDGVWVDLDDVAFNYPDQMVIGFILAVGDSDAGDGRVSYIAKEMTAGM